MPMLVGGMIDTDIDPLSPSAPLGEITQRMATYNLVAMPVVDEKDRLVGAVTVVGYLFLKTREIAA